MADSDLNSWLNRINAAKTQKEMYAVLDDFKGGDWNDEDRATVAKHYMRLIAQLPTGEDKSTAGGVGD
jgi:hypothetical protein